MVNLNKSHLISQTFELSVCRNNVLLKQDFACEEAIFVYNELTDSKKRMLSHLNDLDLVSYLYSKFFEYGVVFNGKVR